MRCSPFFSVAALALTAVGVDAQSNTVPVTGIQGNATIVDNNPVGPIYRATLPPTEYFNPNDPRGNVQGNVSATAAPGGKGVAFTVQFSNLPTSGGPFLYHIHVAPVNSTGSCASTMAHLDPFIRGEHPPCIASLPQTCQVGDLSGKYGAITSDPFTASYVDPYVSLVPGLGSFFGNRSITVHFANTTRITCASFEAVPGTVPGTGAANATSTAAGGATATQTGLPRYTGAAAGTTIKTSAIIGAAVAAVFL